MVDQNDTEMADPGAEIFGATDAPFPDWFEPSFSPEAAVVYWTAAFGSGVTLPIQTINNVKNDFPWRLQFHAPTGRNVSMTGSINLRMCAAESLPVPGWRVARELSIVESCFDAVNCMTVPPSESTSLLRKLGRCCFHSKALSREELSESGTKSAEVVGVPDGNDPRRAYSYAKVRWEKAPFRKFDQIRDVHDDMAWGPMANCRNEATETILQWLHFQFRDESSDFYQNGCQITSFGYTQTATTDTDQILSAFTRFTAAVPLLFKNNGTRWPLRAPFCPFLFVLFIIFSTLFNIAF